MTQLILEIALWYAAVVVGGGFDLMHLRAQYQDLASADYLPRFDPWKIRAVGGRKPTS